MRRLNATPAEAESVAPVQTHTIHPLAIADIQKIVLMYMIEDGYCDKAKIFTVAVKCEEGLWEGIQTQCVRPCVVMTTVDPDDYSFKEQYDCVSYLEPRDPVVYSGKNYATGGWFPSKKRVPTFRLVTRPSEIALARAQKHPDNLISFPDEVRGIVAIHDFGNVGITSLHNFLRSNRDFNGPLNHLDVSQIKSMNSAFNSSRFDGPLDRWNVGNVVDFTNMFLGATTFNQPIGNWDTSSARSMHGMFYAALWFNQDIGSWNTANVQDMAYMFSGARDFNRCISQWDVSKVTDMRYMFEDTTDFNTPLNSWDTSSCANMEGMFQRALRFNQPISSWNVSKVHNMFSMFCEAGAFNQSLDGWDVSNVKVMSFMFHKAIAFNGSLQQWRPIRLEKAVCMFLMAPKFNQPLGDWKLDGSVKCTEMFAGATAFKQNLSQWVIDMDVTKPCTMFDRCKNMTMTNDMTNMFPKVVFRGRPSSACRCQYLDEAKTDRTVLCYSCRELLREDGL